jgi:UDP-N-acetylglucosamine 4,6-dehydratase/5-epimerase
MTNQSILITGGTGSFGRKFVETVLSRFQPRRLIVFSRDELKQHEMRREFPDTGDSPMRYFIGDVRDADRLRRAFNGVDIVVHAAAMKQVPACEYNPFEAVQTNILGTKNVIDAALDQKVKRVMAISTDKAVNPVNLYGATKLCAEKMCVQANSYAGDQDTRFAVCRYGNVIGSRGSVIPILLEQRQRGKVTVTDPRMTRFWITVEQGVDFVLVCLAKMHGGETFVPKIPSMSIMDVARSVAPDSDVEYIGCRPGEKLHEMLISEDESQHTVEQDGMYIVKPTHGWWGVSNWSNAKAVTPGFLYRSDTNAEWLDAQQLRELVGC